MPLTRLVFFVPGEPVAKERPRTVTIKKSGRVVTFTPSATVHFEKHVRTHALRAVALGQWKPGRFDRFFVALVFQLKGDTTRQDLDNLAKSLLDGLQPTAILDDCQIARLVLERVMSHPEPGVRVTIARVREVVYSRPPRAATGAA